MSECESCGQQYGFHLETCRVLKTENAFAVDEDFFIPRKDELELFYAGQCQAHINISSSAFDSDISFVARNGDAVLRIDAEGNIYVKGKLTVNDKQFVDEFRAWFLGRNEP